MGGAIGDSLGMPFEELPLSKRMELYGDQRITDFVSGKPYKLRQIEVELGTVTDDTEMILATTESIVKNGVIIVSDIADHLHKWYKRDLPWLKGPIELRNVGNTTEKALQKYSQGFAYNRCCSESAGCGAAIRVSPLALCCHGDIEYLCKVVLPVARITHCNRQKPLAEEGAICVAASIQYLLNKGKPENLLDFLRTILKTQGFLEQITRVQEGLESWDIDMAAERLGTGSSYLVTEVAGLALFIFLKHSESYEDAVFEVIKVTSPSGVDTDSIASIVGSFCGSYLGIDSIPDRLQQKIEYNEVIMSLSEDLFKLASSYNGIVPFRHK